MERNFKQLTDFLVGLGVEAVPHTQKSYLAHLIAVHGLMHRQGCDEELCRAGMFHSIYGTELFQGFKLPLERRDEVRALIGEWAERMAYLNCAMDRASFDRSVFRDKEPFPVTDRLTGEVHELSRADFDDLCRIHLYDWLEQAPRSQHGWGFRREAYRRMAERLGAEVLAAHDAVFAAEGAGQCSPSDDG